MVAKALAVVVCAMLSVLSVGALGLEERVPPVDDDDDQVPDVVESNTCGRRIVESMLGVLLGVAGSCSAIDDHEAPGVPGKDLLEILLCGIEDRNDPTDGHCTDGHYTAPRP